MRVILSAYRNQQKRSDEVVETYHIDHQQLEEENEPSPSDTENQSEEAAEHESGSNSTDSSVSLSETPASKQPASAVSTPESSSKPEAIDLERKLPATKSETVSRKRKLPPSQPNSLKKPAVESNDSQKPAAKMTAGRYADDDGREPPPPHDENTISLLENLPEDNSTVSSNSQDDFSKELKQRGLEIIQQEGDGNCLFRAVSLQVYGDANSHLDIRHQCLDHMAKDEEHFRHFVEDEDFKSYLIRKRQEGVHGNNPEIQAISELFNRPVEVFTPEKGATPLNIFQAEYKTSDVPIRLSYADNHYDAVVDPLLPTAGLGLGLPGLQPGLADKMQLDKAVRESDQLADQAELKKAYDESHDDQLQRAIKESALSVDQDVNKKAIALSDLEATNLDLEQAVSSSCPAPFSMRFVVTHRSNYYFPCRRCWRVPWRLFAPKSLDESKVLLIEVGSRRP